MSGDALRASNAAADAEFSDKVPGSGTTPCPYACWIELELLEEDGTPVPNATYWLKPPTGDLRRGKLDERGFARIEPLPCGTCTVRFPEIDDEDWLAEARPVQQTTHWIELELVDDSGEPVADAPYEVTDSAGVKHTGTLDALGLARVAGLSPGACLVRFPGVDQRDWVQ